MHRPSWMREQLAAGRSEESAPSGASFVEDELSVAHGSSLSRVFQMYTSVPSWGMLPLSAG